MVIAKSRKRETVEPLPFYIQSLLQRGNLDCNLD